MSTYSNWFPHDFDTGNDPRIMKLEMKYGLEGSGLYHRILEHMGTSDNHTLDSDEINFIAKRNFCTIENPAKIFLALNLFLIKKDGQVYSKSLIERLSKLDENRNKRAIAGKKGGLKKSSNARAMLEQSYKQNASDALAVQKRTEENRIEHKNINNNLKKNNTKKDSEKFIVKNYLEKNNIKWIDQKIWDEWIEHKRKRKTSITKRALNSNISKLKKLGEQNANAIISQSLDRGYTDFYAIKNNSDNSIYKNNSGYKTQTQIAQDSQRVLDEHWTKIEQQDQDQQAKEIYQNDYDKNNYSSDAIIINKF